MGRKKGIGRCHKAGSGDRVTVSARATSSTKAICSSTPGNYQRSAHKRTATTKTNKRNYHDKEKEEDGNAYANSVYITSPSTQTRVCYRGQGGAVSVWKRFYYAGVSRSCERQKELDFGGANSILTAINNSGKSVHEKVAALIIAINNPSIQVLFEAAGIITTIPPSEELATTGRNTLPPSEELATAVPIIPQVLFKARTSNRSDRRKKRNFWVLITQPVEEEAFEFTTTGETRKNASGKAAQMAKSRQVSKIRNTILNTRLSHAQQIVALRDAANHPQLRTSIVKSAGLVILDETEVALFHESQRKRLFETVFSTKKKQGRSTDDRRSFLEAILVACANSPDAEAKQVPKKIARIESLGFLEVLVIDF
jgi:hypothetical protein